MTDSTNNDDINKATFLADATPFLRILAQILQRLLTQLDGQNRTPNNGKRPETILKGD